MALGVWIGHGVPFLIYYDLVSNPISGQTVCAISNAVFAKYIMYCNQVAMGSLLPVLLSVLFGFLAYRNVCQLAYRTIPAANKNGPCTSYLQYFHPHSIRDCATPRLSSAD
jgi:hypothetical protein